MSSHTLYSLSKNSFPIRVTPTVEDPFFGISVTLRNLSEKSNVYLGSNHQHSSLSLNNFGFVLYPKEYITFICATPTDEIFIITDSEETIFVSSYRIGYPVK